MQFHAIGQYTLLMNRPTKTAYKVQPYGDYASFGHEYVWHIMELRSTAEEKWGAWFEFKVELGVAL